MRRQPVEAQVRSQAARQVRPRQAGPDFRAGPGLGIAAVMAQAERQRRRDRPTARTRLALSRAAARWPTPGVDTPANSVRAK